MKVEKIHERMDHDIAIQRKGVLNSNESEVVMSTISGKDDQAKSKDVTVKADQKKQSGFIKTPVNKPAKKSLKKTELSGCKLYVCGKVGCHQTADTISEFKVYL